MYAGKILIKLLRFSLHLNLPFQGNHVCFSRVSSRHESKLPRCCSWTVGHLNFMASLAADRKNVNKNPSTFCVTFWYDPMSLLFDDVSGSYRRWSKFLFWKTCQLPSFQVSTSMPMPYVRRLGNISMRLLLGKSLWNLSLASNYRKLQALPRFLTG